MRFRPGNILPLSVMMTLMILMAGIGIGVVVLEGSKRAGDTDRSVSAYYMADSGIERQLYEVRKNSLSVPDLAGLTMSYPNGTSWKYDASYAAASSKTISSLTTSTVATLELFDPDNVGPANIKLVKFTWQDGPDCTLLGTHSNLELSYADWNLQGNIVPTDFTIERKDPMLVNGASDQNYDLSLDSNRAYRIRIRAQRCSATNILARVYSDAAGTVATTYPGDLTIAAEGTYGQTTQKIAVSMPKLDVLSGLFSFVIFSECSLVKGLGTSVCP